MFIHRLTILGASCPSNNSSGRKRKNNAFSPEALSLQKAFLLCQRPLIQAIEPRLIIQRPIVTGQELAPVIAFLFVEIRPIIANDAFFMKEEQSPLEIDEEKNAIVF